MSRVVGRVVWSLGYIFLLVNVLSCVGVSAAAEPDALTRLEERRRAIANVMEESTVLVLVAKKGKMSGMGSGFVVGNGYVLTNAHVANAGDSYFIASERLRPVRATLVKKAYAQEPGIADFALLRFSPPKAMPVLSFNLKVGRMDRVSAWGFPYMVTQFDQSTDRVLEGNFEKMPPVVYTEGTVSAMVRAGRAQNIIHTAAIASGNSGGPLINSRGEVVGINTWGYKEESEGAFVNASLPAERIVAFLKDCGVTPRMAQGGSGLAGLPRSTPTDAVEPAASSPGSAEGGVAAVARRTQSQREKKPSAPAEDEGAELPEDLRPLLAEAQQGDAEAQGALGALYYMGDDVPQDLDKALQWLRKGAAQGDAIAQYMLGIMHVTETAYKDVPQGMELLRKAADADADFAALLALLLYEGESLGVERDVDASAVYAIRGTEAEDNDARALLSVLTYYGEGVARDRKKALGLARQAAREESALAMAMLGWMYFHGDVVPEDNAKALSYARDAAEADEAMGMGLLALMYYNGSGVQRDLASAEGWAERAAAQANEFGQFVLGILYAKGEGVKKDAAKAWAYLDMAAGKGVGEAMEERDALSAKMTRKELAAGRELQQQWRREWAQ